MRRIASKRARKGAVAVVALVGALVLGACSAPAPAENLAVQDADEGRTVNFFSPMEKISPDTENTARTASDLTIAMAEERLGLTLAYHTYTAENYQDKTYDEVCLERAEHRDEALEVVDVICSDEALQLYAETNRVISPSKNVEVECVEALRPLNDLVQADTYVLASNAGMDVEQWGNTCLIVRDLLGGASVDECMAKLDALQDAA